MKVLYSLAKYQKGKIPGQHGVSSCLRAGLLVSGPQSPQLLDKDVGLLDAGGQVGSDNLGLEQRELGEYAVRMACSGDTLSLGRLTPTDPGSVWVCAREVPSGAHCSPKAGPA